jgi:acetyl-CoA carboxylase biotin carboxyl carrier protein
MTSPLDHVGEIAAWLAATDIDCLELTGPAGHLRLRRGGEPEVTVVGTGDGPAAEDDTVAMPSPGFGIFLRAHPLHETPLVQAGDSVAAGKVLGFLKIGPLLVPVLAPHEGVVSAIVAQDGALVGFSDPLFRFSPQP